MPIIRSLRDQNHPCVTPGEVLWGAFSQMTCLKKSEAVTDIVTARTRFVTGFVSVLSSVPVLFGFVDRTWRKPKKYANARIRRATDGKLFESGGSSTLPKAISAHPHARGFARTLPLRGSHPHAPCALRRHPSSGP